MAQDRVATAAIAESRWSKHLFGVTRKIGIYARRRCRPGADRKMYDNKIVTLARQANVLTLKISQLSL